MTRTIAISNQKGGVAKTTSCISLGACLAEAGRKTLLIDFDPQANLTLAAGFEPEELDGTVVELLQASAPGDNADSLIQPTSQEGLYLLGADQRLVEFENAPPDAPDYEHRLANGLKKLSGSFDYVLIDCPPSLGVLTVMALTAADLALIPLQCDYFATRGLMTLLAIIEAVKQRTNPGISHHLFVTLYDSRPLISRKILDQLRENFPQELFETVIGLDTRLRESAMANEPIISYASKTRASAQYRSLAAEILARCA